MGILIFQKKKICLPPRCFCFQKTVFKRFFFFFFRSFCFLCAAVKSLKFGRRALFCFFVFVFVLPSLLLMSLVYTSWSTIEEHSCLACKLASHDWAWEACPSTDNPPCLPTSRPIQLSHLSSSRSSTCTSWLSDLDTFSINSQR